MKIKVFYNKDCGNMETREYKRKLKSLKAKVLELVLEKIWEQ